jgi:hypothetical protein
MSRITAGLLLCVLAACATDKNAVTKTGELNAGTIRAAIASGKIEAYPPAAGDPKNRYVVSLTAPNAALGSSIHTDAETRTVTVCPALCPPPSNGPAVDLLLRVPQNVHSVLTAGSGDIHVSDVSGPVDATTVSGDVKIQIPSYANASTQTGNVSVLFGDVNWPGNLRFSSGRGDVEVYVPATANAAVDLRTQRGTIFTDFDLHGHASGQAEFIVGKIGSGGAHSITVRVTEGNIRLLRLVPQM